MGVISITRRSETLGNIGGTSMAHGVTDTDAGSARSGAYARTFSPRYYAKHEWSGNDGIARGLGAFAGVAAGIAEREDERESDDLVRLVVDRLDCDDRDERAFTPDEVGADPQRRHLLGDADADGNYVNAQRHGIRLRTGAGTRRLVEETERTFVDAFEGAAREIGASDRAKTRARERLFNYQQGRVKYAFDVQASEYRRMEVQGARDQLSAFTSAYLSGNEDVLDDVFQAREKLGILEGKTAEQRRLDATTLAQGIATATFENWEAEAAGSADPEAVKAAWEERRKAFVSEDGKAPDDPLLSTAYDNGLDKDGEKKVLAAFDRCAKRSVATARYNRVRLDEQNRDALVAEEAGMFKTQVDPKDSGAVMADMEQKSIKYKDLGDKAEQAGNHRLALSYYKTSQSLKNGRARAEDERAAGMRRAAFEATSAEFSLGGYFRNDGGWEEESVWDRQARARGMYARGQIDYAQLCRLMAMTRPEVDEEFRWLRSMALDHMRKVVPNALGYNARRQSFEVSPTKDVRGSTRTGAEWKVYDGEEEATYAQLADALNASAEWMRQNRKSRDEAWGHFLKITEGETRNASLRTIDAKVAFEREAAAALGAAARRREAGR